MTLACTDVSEDIFVASMEGGALRRLTEDPFKDRQPVFTPDSSTIIFFSDRIGRYELWSIRPD